MARGRGGDLARRVAVAVVAIPVVALVAWAGGRVFAGFAAALAAVAAWELYAMAARKGIVTLSSTGVVWAAAFPLLAALPGTPLDLVVPLALLLFTPAALRLRPGSGPTTALATTVFGAAYPGACLAFGVLLREVGRDRPEGMALLFLPLVVTWVGDTAAYFAGKAVGRTPLAPRVSPNKTWEGAAAGLAGSVLAAIAYAPVARAAGLPVGPALAGVLGALIAVAGQAGDLVESLLKRDCGVKDSSTLVPGHGGVLDRLDSLFFAFPVTYVAVRLAWG